MALFRTKPRLAGVLAAAVISSCGPQAPETRPSAEAVPAPPAPATVGPVALVDRHELLIAMAQAAEAAALGEPYPSAVLDLAGRRFSVRAPFGCFGPQSERELSYAFDSDKRTLKVVARPQVWTEDQRVLSVLQRPEAEAVEGFWLPRPWIHSDSCPTSGATGSDGGLPYVGLAEIFDKDSSRIFRRNGKPYEVIRKNNTVPDGVYRLVLEGRIIGSEKDMPVRCRSEVTDRVPLCLALVEFDRVAIEDQSGGILGEWHS